jgi:hypothetical protein
MDAKAVDQFLKDRVSVENRQKQIVDWLTTAAEKLGHRLMPLNGNNSPTYSEVARPEKKRAYRRKARPKAKVKFKKIRATKKTRRSAASAAARARWANYRNRTSGSAQKNGNNGKYVCEEHSKTYKMKAHLAKHMQGKMHRGSKD